MNIVQKSFKELSLKELYDLLQLRSEVFVVEQECIYQDIDGKDENALHILGFEDGELVAYSRCFPPGFYFKEAAIGRVLVKEEFRNKSLGHEILQSSIDAVKNTFNTALIKVSAQQYLTTFYESHGFVQTGEGYLEDGIPHIAMVKE